MFDLRKQSNTRTMAWLLLPELNQTWSGTEQKGTEYVKFANERSKRDFKFMGKEAATVNEVSTGRGKTNALH